MLSAAPHAQGGAALLNELFATALYVVEHVIPKVHKYLSWDFEDHDLGPILPVSILIITIALWILSSSLTDWRLGYCTGDDVVQEWSAPECYPMTKPDTRACSTSLAAEAA